MLENVTVGQERVTVNMTMRPAATIWQKQVLLDKHQFVVICAGRRTGKTILALMRLISAATSIKDANCWYVAPTYGMAKAIAWDELKQMLEQMRPYGAITRIYESDMMIRLWNGSTIQLKGSDNEDALRGVGLDFVVLDEYAIMRRQVWDEILRPSVVDRKGTALFISTPKGFNHFYALYNMALQEPATWASYHFKTVDNPHISVPEIERARKDMDPRAFRQEFEASFESFGGQVFSDFDRSRHLPETPFNSALEYAVGLDFGWASPMAAVLANVTPDESVHVFGELGMTQTTVLQFAEKMKTLTPGHLPRLIGCDPAGDAKNEATGKSSVDALRSVFGYATVKFRNKYPGVIQDRIDLIRKWLRNGKLTIHKTACPNLVRAMESYRYPDPKGSIQSELPLKDGVSDHWIDALGELMINRFPPGKSSWSVM